ncbi:MAG: threonine-phosphate decarboxylase CobD [Haloferacaceae archaeon]
MDPDAVDAVEPVVHGGAADPKLLDFSANTNPERPPGVAGVYESALAAARRYPAGYEGFVAAAADYVGTDPEHVVPTAGGLRAIRLTVQSTVGHGDSALVPAPSFSEYAREVRLQGADPDFVPHDEVLEADPAGHALAVVCTPNNPTGDLADPEALRAFADRCRDAGTTLLVDEAFLDFTDAPSMAGEPGVVVARSLTKVFGLPGLRAGFAVATGEHRERLRRAGQPWDLATPAALVGEHCLRQEAFVRRTRERVAAERERVREALAGRFEVRPSDAPFLLLDVGERSVEGVVEGAREAGVVVRDATTFRGLDNHVRVAIKRPAENDRLLDALADD